MQCNIGKSNTVPDQSPHVLPVAVSAADVVGVHVLFPATFVDTVIADVAHQAAFRHVHSFYAFAVVYEVCCAAFVNTEIPGGFDSVDICTEEDEFPAVLFFLALDHFLNPFGGVLVAGVFVAVGSDDEDCLFGAVFIAGVLVYVSDMVNGPADGVKEGGTAAGIVFFVGQGLDACKRNPIMEHFHFSVKENGGDVCLARFLLLLFDGAVEAPDGVLFEPAHGSAAVEDEYDFGESLFHDCLRAAICAA